MRRPSSVRVVGVLAPGLAVWLVTGGQPALASGAPGQAAVPSTLRPAAGGPPCVSGPGGLIGCLPIPSPGEVLRGAARAAGQTAMDAFTSFFTDAAKWFIESLKPFLVGADRPDLSVGWWVERYDRMLALAVVVAVATLLLALLDAAAKGSLEGLARALFADVPAAAIVAGVAPLLIQYLVDLADWLSSRLLQDFGVDVAKTLSSSAQWFATFGAVTGQPGVPALAGVIAALLTILAALIVFLELLLRANAVYLIAALIPVVYAVRIWPAARSVARHTTEVLLAVIFAQPVVALAISMGAAAGGALHGVGNAGVKDFGMAIAGAVFLLLGAMCPWAMLALVPGVARAMDANRQRAAVTGGARSGIQVAYTGSYIGRLAAAGGSRKSAGGSDGAAAAAGGWGLARAAQAGAQATVGAGQAVGERQAQMSGAAGATASGSSGGQPGSTGQAEPSGSPGSPSSSQRGSSGPQGAGQRPTAGPPSNPAPPGPPSPPGGSSPPTPPRNPGKPGPSGPGGTDPGRGRQP